MSCEIDLELKPIYVNCDHIPTGGIKRVWLSATCDTAIGFGKSPSLDDGTQNNNYGVVTTLAFRDRDESAPTGIGKIYELEFNTRDEASNVTEALSIDANGIVNNVQTLTLELPKNNRVKRNLLNELVNPFARFILFIEMNNQGYSEDPSIAPSLWAYGVDRGVRVTSGVANSGTGNAEFNGYTMTVTGSETELAYAISSKVKDSIYNKLVPVDGDPYLDWRETVNDPAFGIVVPRQDCIPIPL